MISFLYLLASCWCASSYAEHLAGDQTGRQVRTMLRRLASITVGVLWPAVFVILVCMSVGHVIRHRRAVAEQQISYRQAFEKYAGARVK